MTDAVEINEEKKVRKPRSSKNQLFAQNQKDILNKLYDILSITENNRTFYTDDLDSNNVKINAILNLKDDIRKYFSCGSWKFFTLYKEDSKYYLSLIKSIFKAMNIKTSVAYVMNDSTSIEKKGLYIY